MKYIITEATNFLRIFRLPTQYPSGYCFGGGHPVKIQLVDWYNAVEPSKLWETPSIEYDAASVEYEQFIVKHKQYITQKAYFKETSDYLVITDYGDAFLVNPESRCRALEHQLELIKTREHNNPNGR